MGKNRSNVNNDILRLTVAEAEAMRSTSLIVLGLLALVFALGLVQQADAKAAPPATESGADVSNIEESKRSTDVEDKKKKKKECAEDDADCLAKAAKREEQRQQKIENKR